MGQEDPLGEGMAIHFGILAWRIPWTEEPGVSVGSQKDRLKWLSTQTGSSYRSTNRCVHAIKYPALSKRIPGGGNGYPLQYCCLENPTDRGAWQATGHGVAKSQTRQRNEENVHALIWDNLSDMVSETNKVENYIIC